MYAFLIRPIYFFSTAPSPYVVELPKFKGMIIASHIMHPVALEITDDFETVSNWGPEAVLIYGSTQNPHDDNAYKIALRVFYPNPANPDVPRYAQKVIDLNEIWGETYYVGRIKKEGNILKVFPTLNVLSIIGMVVVTIALMAVVFVGIGSLLNIFEEKKPVLLNPH